LPAVSVIIAAFNAQATIGETLSSLARQSHRDWEAIVIDDCSSDETALLGGFRDDRVRVIRLPTNQGPSAARNVGIENASADVVFLLDADDRWLPEYLESQLACLADASDPAVAIVACDALVIRDGTADTATWLEQNGTTCPPSLDSLLEKNAIFVSVGIRRDALERVGLFDESMRGAEDYDLWIRMLESGFRVAWNPIPLVRYRVSAESLSADTSRQAQYVARVLENAVTRGALTPTQVMIAKRQAKYQRALALASAVYRQRSRASLTEAVRAAPLLIEVLIRHPSLLPQWAANRKQATR
jgi:glycosyltransferase involved in cell wall biosynthesis